MRIAEIASHCPFQDHELSISQHVPEREYAEQQDQQVGGESRGSQGRGNLDPITPLMGIAGEWLGHLSWWQSPPISPGGKHSLPGKTSRREGPEQRDVPTEPRQDQEESAERDPSAQGGESQNGLYQNHLSPIDLQGRVLLKSRCLPDQLGNKTKNSLGRSALLQNNN